MNFMTPLGEGSSYTTSCLNLLFSECLNQRIEETISANRSLIVKGFAEKRYLDPGFYNCSWKWDFFYIIYLKLQVYWLTSKNTN